MEVSWRLGRRVLCCRGLVYRFDDFELDAARLELRHGGDVVAAEPQVFALLLLLVENSDRVVGKDEMIEKVWDGRIVSDAAIASRIKSARRALGDDGKQQRYIRTLHGSGVRFVGQPVAVFAPLLVHADEPAGATVTPAAPAEASRPSIAVLPFRRDGAAQALPQLADALADDLITQLSQLRWLFVIARGSCFRFRAPDVDVREVGRALGVRYCLTGSIELAGQDVAVTVELADAAGGGIVWAERYRAVLDDVHDIRQRIVAGIVAALEIRIPLHEAQRASTASPENLDAWSAYHLGLQHMFRFNRRDNAAATSMFEAAVARDPGFARAHAGLSFTHFQDAFLHYSQDPHAAVSRARLYAERSVDLDPLDPFANMTMGRSLWLEGDLEGSTAWLDRATTLSPNYAQAIYSRGWAATLSGRGEQGQEHSDLAMSLSPLDPLLYAMLGTRALSHVVRGDDAEAARWAERAARAPGAHVLIALIAVIAHELHGDHARAGLWVQSARRRLPGITGNDFFRSFPFADDAVRLRIAGALGAAGLAAR